MGEELRNTEWILANVSLWLLPLLSFSIFILFFSSYIAIYIFNVVDGLRNLFLLSYRFRGPRFDHRSSIGAMISFWLKLFAIVCRLRWLESSNRDYFLRIFRYFSNFFFFFFCFSINSKARRNLFIARKSQRHWSTLIFVINLFLERYDNVSNNSNFCLLNFSIGVNISNVFHSY